MSKKTIDFKAAVVTARAHLQQIVIDVTRSPVDFDDAMSHMNNLEAAMKLLTNAYAQAVEHALGDPNRSSEAAKQAAGFKEHLEKLEIGSDIVDTAEMPALPENPETPHESYDAHRQPKPAKKPK